jgi:hypothetical protein
MKKKLFYIAALIICLCMLTTASKECGKIMCEGSLRAVEAKNEKPETKYKGQEDSKTDFSLVDLLFFQTI